MSQYAGRRSTTQDHERTGAGTTAAMPGKQTLVERAYAPVQQRGQGQGADAAGVHAAAERGIATPAARLPHMDAIQRAFGRHDISGVQAHVGAEAAASANAMGANAYATGDHVVLGRGDDLHTVAHEAAHVVQQRAGVHLSGGVGRTGDPYERHADAVADLVVQGKSAESLLDQHAGSGGGGRAVQRESAYDGLMPAHDTFGDSYTFNGVAGNKNFTYHHIIPENKLKEVTAQLAVIRAYFEGAGAESEKRAGFNAELGGMMTDAKKNWLTTRVKNTTFQIERAFNDYRLPVSEGDVRTILANTEERLDPIFGKFQGLYKQKTRGAFDTAKGKVNRAITEAVRSDAFVNAARNLDEDALTNTLTASLDTAIYAMGTIMPGVMRKLGGLVVGRKKDSVTKSEIRDTIVAAIYELDFDAYFRARYAPLDSSVLLAGNLKKILQDNALPHAEGEHLEHAVQWNPGNVHRGPESKKRLDPKAVGLFNELVDDGGDRFEKAAANIVSEEHFAALTALNTRIDTFVGVAIVGGVPDDAKIDSAVALVKKMHELMAFPTTGFQEGQWQMEGTTKMRLRRNDDRLRAAGLID